MENLKLKIQNVMIIFCIRFPSLPDSSKFFLFGLTNLHACFEFVRSKILVHAFVMIQSLNFKLHFIRRKKIDKVLVSNLILLFSLFLIIYDLSNFLVIAIHNKQKPEIELSTYIN
jgi:hypothetical protein